MDFSYLTLIPVLLLIVTALALGIRWIIPGFRFTWLIAVAGALLSAVCLIVLYRFLPLRFNLIPWTPVELFGVSPEFLLDSTSWPLSLAMVVLCLAEILTATARYQYQSDAYSWMGCLFITATALVAVQSANLVMLLLSWTALDCVELGILLLTSKDRHTFNRAILFFSVKIIGTWMAYYAAVQDATIWENFNFYSASSKSGLFFISGIGLRLGLIPFHTFFIREPKLSRGLGTVLRLIPAASCLAALARIPAGTMETAPATFLLFFTVLAAIYSSISWVTAEDELAGRPYWISAIVALALTSSIRGYPLGAVVWGSTMLLCGASLFLFSARNLRMAFLPILGLWCLSGLPFSPSAGGWQGLVSGPAPYLNGLFILVHVLLLIGFAKHALRVVDNLSAMEQWIQAIYSIGLLLLILCHLGLGIVGWEGSWTMGVWWASLLSVVLAGLTTVAYLRLDPIRRSGQTGAQKWLWDAMGVFSTKFMQVLSFSWLFRLVNYFFHLIDRLVGIFTTILEGDGGVLWVFLLLALLVTLLESRGIG